MLVGKGRTGFCFILEKVEGSEVLGSEGLQNSLKAGKRDFTLSELQGLEQGKSFSVIISVLFLFQVK